MSTYFPHLVKRLLGDVLGRAVLVRAMSWAVSRSGVGVANGSRVDGNMNLLLGVIMLVLRCMSANRGSVV